MEWISAKNSHRGVASEPTPRKPLDVTALLSLILRIGVILSAAIIVLGVLLFVITGQSGYITNDGQTAASSAQQFITYHPADPNAIYFPTNPLEIWQGLLSFKPFAIIMFGLGLLILTPVMNVALAALGFLLQRNRNFMLISLFVLAALLLGFLLGKIES